MSCLGLKYFDSILSWLETQKNLDPSFILKALELRDLACQKMVEREVTFERAFFVPETIKAGSLKGIKE